MIFLFVVTFVLILNCIFVNPLNVNISYKNVCVYAFVCVYIFSLQNKKDNNNNKKSRIHFALCCLKCWLCMVFFFSRSVDRMSLFYLFFFFQFSFVMYVTCVRYRSKWVTCTKEYFIYIYECVSI